MGRYEAPRLMHPGCSRWAVGVLMYEMVAGYPPFYDEDRVAMFRNICQVKYTVPSHFSKVRRLGQPEPGRTFSVPAFAW